MAVQITVTESKYFSEIKNGPLFDQNTGDFGTHLKGSLGERLKAELTVQIRWSMPMLNYNVTGGDTITLQSGSFFSEGFSVGDSANLSLQDGSQSVTFTVTSISSDGKVMNTSGLAPIANQSYGTADPDLLRGLTQLEGLKYKFNFIGNTDSTNFISVIDETTLAYKTDGIRTASPTPVISIWDDTILGSQTGNHQVSFVNDISDNGFNGSSPSLFPLNSIQEFKIEHEFILTPYYLDGELTNLETLTRPERIEAGVSLKHVIDFEFRSTLSNPNTAKTGRYDNVLGETSYFDENFGDEATQYSITNVVLTSGSGIDSDNVTNLQFSVLSADASFLATHPVVMYHSKLPELDEYNESTELFETNFVFESLRSTINGAPTNGTIFTDLDVDLDTTSKIDFSVNIQLTAAQKLLVDEGDDYLLSVGVANDALTTDLSDKAILKVNLSEYIKDLAVPDLMENTKFDFFTHVMPFTTGLEVGFTGLEAWVQDGIMLNWAFTLDRTLNAVLERFRIRLVALKTADDTFFPLEDVEYDLSGVIVTPGTPTTQQIEIAKTRGFPLGEDSIFNLKTFTTGTYSAPDQPYSGQTSFLINWQEWLSLPGADAIFYNVAQPNDGLNQKASQYSLKEGYEIRFLMDADVSVDGATVTNYKFKSPEATIRDFEEQDGSPISWTPVKETFDLDGANVNQEILTNQNTRVEFTYTPSAAPGLADLYWGHYTIEEVNQPGVAIDRMSTLNYIPLTGQDILIPLDGETRVKQSLSGGNIVHEVLVNFNKLNPAKSYNVYGRLGLVDQTIFVPPVIFRDTSIDFDDNANFIVFQQSEAMANAALTDGIFQLLDGSDDIQYKSDVANLGGDRIDWVAATNYDTFAELAVALAANSALYIYIAVDEANYPIILKEGLIINHEAIGVAVTPSSFTFTFDSGIIDLDQIRWFNQKVDISLQSQSIGVTRVHYALRVVATTGGEYTQFMGFDAVGLAAWNAAVLLLADDVKYGLHINLETGPVLAGLTVTFDVDYIQAGSDEFEVSQQVGLNTVNDQRPFVDNIGSGVPEAVGFFGDASSTGLNLGTGRNTLFDIQNDNDFTCDFWITYTEIGGGIGNTLLMSRGALLGSTFSQSNGIQFSLGSFGIACSLLNTSSIRLFRVVPYDWAKGHKYHIVITYTPVKSGGFYRGSGFNMYVNGYKIEDTTAVSENIPTDGTTRTNTIEPTTVTQGSNYEKPLMYQTGVLDQGAMGSPDIFSEQGDSTLKSTHALRIWDLVLTDEEAYQLFKQGPMINANLPQNANILDNYNFANPNLISFTVPNTGGGTDAELVDGDIGTTWSTIVADNGILNW